MIMLISSSLILLMSQFFCYWICVFICIVVVAINSVCVDKIYTLWCILLLSICLVYFGFTIFFPTLFLFLSFMSDLVLSTVAVLSLSTTVAAFSFLTMVLSFCCSRPDEHKGWQNVSGTFPVSSLILITSHFPVPFLPPIVLTIDEKSVHEQCW